MTELSSAPSSAHAIVLLSSIPKTKDTILNIKISVTAALRLVIFPLSLLAALGAPVAAATSTWTAAGGTSNFSDAGNWDAFPTPNCIMVFPAGAAYASKGAPVNDMIGLTIDQLNVYEAYTISGNAITCKNINDLNASTANITLPISTAGSAVLTITVTNGGAILNLSGKLSGAGPVTYGGPGIKRLNGTINNTLSGTSIVALGELVLDSSAAEPIAGPLVINTGATVTLKSAPEIRNRVVVTVNGTFDLAAATGSDGSVTEMIGGLSGVVTAGKVLLGANTLGCSGQVAPTNYVGGFSGTGAFRQSDSGTEILSGTSFPYTGATLLAGGATHIWGSLLSSLVTVTSGTLVMANDCTVGPVTLSGATSVLSFDETISAMTMHGTTPSLTVGSGSTFQVVAKSPTNYSTVSTAAASISGAVLAIDTSTFSPSVSSVMTIITNTGSSSIGGTFAGLAEGATVASTTNSGTSFIISYVGGSGNDVTLTGSTVASDTTAPTLSAVTSTSITGNSATITWTSNEASDSQVEYGQSTVYGTWSVLGTASVTSHSVVLSGLIGSALYHYRVYSRDAAGNRVVSADASFTTAADTIAPTISAVTVGTVTEKTATITWTTDEASDGQVDYGTTVIYGSSAVDGSFDTSHSLTLVGLTGATTYHFRVLSRDASGNLTLGADGTFTTTPEGSGNGTPASSDDNSGRCGVGGGLALLVGFGLVAARLMAFRRRA